MKDGIHSLWAALECFIDSQTSMIYDWRVDSRSDPRQFLPTRRQVLDDVPNQCGWMAGFEDCALNIGTVLPALIDHYQKTHDSFWKDAVVKLTEGLMKLTRVSETAGFLPRGVLPDGATHYRNSSVDQYTMAARALQRLWDWDLISSPQRTAIKQFAVSLVNLLDRHAWNIPTEDGQAAWVCESSQFWPGRSTRLLQMVLTAYYITGSETILDIYRKLRDEKYCRRTRGVVNLPGYCDMPYFILQEQFALNQLSKLEPDSDFRLLWTMHLHDFAEHAVKRLTEKYPAAEQLETDLKKLPTLRNTRAGWQAAYTKQDYHDRHNQAAVEKGQQPDTTSQENADLSSAGFCVRAAALNPRTDHELKCVREPLELMFSFLLAENNELIDVFGKELFPVVRDYYQVIETHVRPEEICAAHSLTNLLAVAIQMHSAAAS